MSQQIDRALAAQFGREALMIGEQGHYTTSSGKTVDIQPMISKAVKGTVSCPPEMPLKSKLKSKFRSNPSCQNG